MPVASPVEHKADFKKDLAKGEEWELECIDRLKPIFPLCTFRKVEGYFPDYDLICDHCQVTVECKRNWYIYDYGFLKGEYSKWINFENRTLKHTKAMYWAVTTPYYDFLVTDQELRRGLRHMMDFQLRGFRDSKNNEKNSERAKDRDRLWQVTVEGILQNFRHKRI